MEAGSKLSWRSVMTAGCLPLVFKHAVDEWPAQQWTPEYLCQVLGDKLLDSKISLIQHEDFQWEPDCLHLKVTMRQYTDWLQGDTDRDNPLRLIDKTKFSCYIDYKYMKDMFEEQPQVLKSVFWDIFGLDERGGDHSTIWIGSCGTYTPCHQDTYGFNLVAQIQGRKRWYLFNPDQTDCMYPTRIPYEESSIYSEVNVRYPDLDKHPLFQKTTPYIIELVPGDVLYVPRHWWHFVESLEPSMSINTWVPMVEDAQSHLEESVSRLLYTCLSTTLLTETEQNSYLNTGEKLVNAEVNLQYVQRAVQALQNSQLAEESRNRDLNTRQTFSADVKQGQFDGQKQTVEHSCNNLEKLSNKFQDYLVTVACLCGVNIDHTEGYYGNSVGKRKVTHDNENESIKECVADIPSEKKNKRRKIESDATLNVEHGMITTDEASLSGVMVDSNTAASKYAVLMNDDCKTNKSVIEIFAAKPFMFNEYLRFLEIVFDYELKDRENYCIDSNFDKQFKLFKSSLMKESSTVSSSLSTLSPLVPVSTEDPLHSAVTSLDSLTSTKSSSEAALTSQTSTSLKQSQFSVTSSFSSMSSSSLSPSGTISFIPDISSSETTLIKAFTTDADNTNESLDRNAEVNYSDNDERVVKMKPNSEKDEHRFISDINDQNTPKTLEVSDDELMNADAPAISNADVINSILDPNVIRHIGYILLNKIKK
ncbi:HSPB1-associated protein 1-like isoform X2 [Mercenaria mercenaria]|nr:HSPB1-associated protein 1-like isoform X2 [Mercenaria mercenaria]XP_053393394.1 HSPB1-associated protein 1-like isoform X2 [Mercenaria mercenaria]XP_053393395.1 HSPB1-associated protein 1-like isoform X2 [Mercenaria mercenaria]